jgi:hypothetical protein
MTATHNTNCTASNAPVLYLALELGVTNWKLAFAVGLGQKPRLKTITARTTLGLLLNRETGTQLESITNCVPVSSLREGPRPGV